MLKVCTSLYILDCTPQNCGINAVDDLLTYVYSMGVFNSINDYLIHSYNVICRTPFWREVKWINLHNICHNKKQVWYIQQDVRKTTRSDMSMSWHTCSIHYTFFEIVCVEWINMVKHELCICFELYILYNKTLSSLTQTVHDHANTDNSQACSTRTKPH